MGTQFYRGFVVIPTDLILRSKYLWGWLWLTTDRVNSASHFYGRSK
ncbi:hypothetical protein MAL08_15275 [Leptospira noguchii]|nr:hypothetical protein [Leptospira noguchii]UOG37391.1 hypothetical protein MAL08_15275 [Leptospira noguchii]